jgi:NAD-dependent SIR2 family protein deacetylase
MSKEVEKAINHFKNRVAFEIPVYETPQFKTIINELQEMDKKEKPMKVIIHDDLGAFECSNCLNRGIKDSLWLFNEKGEYRYCPRCGQRLDWNAIIEDIYDPNNEYPDINKKPGGML